MHVLYGDKQKEGYYLGIDPGRDKTGLALVDRAGRIIAVQIKVIVRTLGDVNDIPKPFRGSALVLITAGLMAMAFFGFSGVI